MQSEEEVAAVASLSVVAAPGGHTQDVGKGFDGINAKLYATVLLQVNVVPVGGVTQLLPVGIFVATVQGQVTDGAVQRVPLGQIAPGIAGSAVAPTPTALHLQATAGAFGTIAQVHAVAVASLHVPTSVALGAVQPVVQPAGGLRTQASSILGL